MGFFDLGFILVVLAPACIIGGLVTGGIAWLLSAGVEDERRRGVLARAVLLPLTVLAAVGTVVVGQNAIDARFFHRPTSVAPLAGEYVLQQPNDRGLIAPSRAQAPPNSFTLDGDGNDEGPYLWYSQPVGVDDALGNVTGLQVADPLILGTYRIDGRPGERYFLLDVRSGATSLFTDSSGFRTAAGRRQIAPALETVPAAFAHHRAWFDRVAEWLLYGLPSFGLIWLIFAPLWLRWRSS